MVVAFQLLGMLAALALGFVLGRIWEMRREIRREFASCGALRALWLSLRARVDTSGLGRSEQPRVDPVMTSAEREAREIAALMASGANVMQAIREIKERRAA